MTYHQVSKAETFDFGFRESFANPWSVVAPASLPVAFCDLSSHFTV